MYNNKFRKLLSAAAAVAMVVTVTAMPVMASDEQTVVATVQDNIVLQSEGFTGTGSAEDPYLLTCDEENQAALAAFLQGTAPADTVYFQFANNYNGNISVEIPAGFSIDLDMAGHTITQVCPENQTRYMLFNYGDLTLRDSVGEGKIIANTSFIKNYGTLTVESGTYSAAKIYDIQADGQDISSCIFNNLGGTLTFNDGYVDAKGFALNSADGPNGEPGLTTINGGTFFSSSCSHAECSGKYYAYCVRNSSGTMIVNDATVIGSQGGLAIAGGYGEIRNGSFTTQQCPKGHNNVFYALYVAGEFGGAKAVVSEGTFESKVNNAVLVGNSADGGLKRPASVCFTGGTFTCPEGKKAVAADEGLGTPSIIGGTYSSDVSAYVSPAAKYDTESGVVTPVSASQDDVVAYSEKLGGVVYYYTSLEDAVEDAGAGETVTLKAGEYTGPFEINKPITLQGEEGVVFKGYIFINADDVTIDNFEFTEQAVKSDYDENPLSIAVNIVDNTCIKNCDFTAPETTGISGRYKGIVTNSGGFSGITVQDCTFENFETSVHINPNGTDVALSHNVVSNGLYGFRLLGVNGAVIEENTFQQSGALEIRPDHSNTVKSQNITISGNKFAVTDTPSWVVPLNLEYKDGYYGYEGVLDVSSNYWGSETPDFTQLINGNVTMDNYYKNEAMTQVVTLIEAKVRLVQNGNQVQVYLDGDKDGTAAEIENLVTAEMTFTLSGEELAIAGFEAANADWTVAEQAGGKYLLYANDGTKGLSGESILLGTLTVGGYGTGKVTVSNISVKQGSTDGENLVVNNEADTAELDITVSKEQTELTVALAFNHNIAEGNTAADNGFTVTVTGADGTKQTFEIGTDEEEYTAGNAEVTTSVNKGERYTVEVKGAGYRTFRQSVLMENAKTMNVWNNAKDTAAVVVDEVEKTVTFLAGDIVMDNNINLYDLSAVVSYFGQAKAEGKDILRYDLNRDGVIDSTDVAMVLVSWGK